MATPSAELRSVPAWSDVFPTVVDLAGLGVIVFDEALRCLQANAHAGRMLGEITDVAEAIRSRAIDRDREPWSDYLRELIAAGATKRWGAVALRSPDNADLHLEIVGATLPTPDGRRGLLLLDNITDRVHLENQLAVSERLAAVGKLCATVAHELNNPLDGMLRYLSLAQRLVSDYAEGKPATYLEQAREAALRMVEVVRALLEFSRNAPPALADDDIAGLVEKAVRGFEETAARQRVAILCHFPQRSLPVFRGNQLFQVFCNLIKNAIDAMPNGGALTITARTDHHNLLMTFEDTGPGLPAATEQLFEPFFTTKPPGKGTGLGLAVCREMVERFGGRIAASNRTPAPGAVFRIEIPLAAADAPGRAAMRLVGRDASTRAAATPA